jgi:TRAP-type transport system periplasmic protein
VLLAVTALWVISPLSARPVRVKLATLAPKGTSFHLILQEMGQAWKNAPDGGVRLTLFTDGTMGGEADMVRRMGLGQLQAGLLTTAGLTEIDLAVGALQNIPMAYRTLDEASYVREKMAPQLEQTFVDKGYVVLGWFDTGWVYIFSKKKLEHPSDLRGEKVFVVPGNSGVLDLARSMNTQPVELEPPDVLVSLQTGLVTVAPAPPIYALAGQFFQPAAYMLELNWAPLSGGLIISQKAWEQMTPGQQAVVKSTAAEACRKLTERARQEMVESITAMEKRGLTVQHLEGELLEEWTEYFEAIHPQVRGNVVPAAAFDQIMSLLSEYRADSSRGNPGR